ncbi:MAG: hypothetical protein ACYC4L_19585 [Chloroflexota bacterium]
MPTWSPLEIGLYVGFVCATLWSARTAYKRHGVAGFYMIIETRFWRSLAINFAATFLLTGLLAALLAGAVWLLARLLIPFF